MLRRDFLLSSGIAILAPYLIREEEIVGLKVQTYFELEQVFTHGQLHLYEPVDQKPTTLIELKYSSGKIEKYTGDKTVWVTEESFKVKLKSKTPLFDGEFGGSFNGYRQPTRYPIYSIKLDKQNKRLSFEVEDCYCLITGLK
jgi:hypothetical protein